MKYKHIVIVTGAGLSAEAGVGAKKGIPTFRDAAGLWTENDPMEVVSVDGYAKNKAFVLNFHNKLRKELLSGDYAPNAAHYALSKLQREYKGKVTIISQNIDHLDDVAGSSVLKIHGSLFQSRCDKSGKTMEWSGNLNVGDMCQCCLEKNQLRPNVVWFGETPHFLDEAFDAARDADLFVSIGTSGSVYPAAGLVHVTKNGCELVEINFDETETSSYFFKKIRGKATETVPEFVESLLKS